MGNAFHGGLQLENLYANCRHNWCLGNNIFICAFSSLAAEVIMRCENFLDKTQAKNVNKQLAQAAKFTAAVFALCGIYGVIQILTPRWPEKLLNAVIVQQNIDPWEGGDKKSIEISKKLTKKGIRQLSEQGKETDLVIWSEGVLSKNFPKAANYYSHFPEDESLKEFIASTQTPFLTARFFLTKTEFFQDSTAKFNSFHLQSGFLMQKIQS